jgi:signal transduction histidine kinase
VRVVDPPGHRCITDIAVVVRTGYGSAVNASKLNSASPASDSQTNQPNRWDILGGERFYALGRWIMIVLLFAITHFLIGEDGRLWPISLDLQPLVLVLWIYTVFSLLVTVALFIPAVESLVSLAFLVDIAFISLMTFFGGEKIVIFFPLYLLPLINAAIRQAPAVSLLSGILAAGLYISAFMGWRRLLAPEALMTLLDYIALALRGITLSVVPWITSGLTERSIETNRRSVAIARMQAEQSLQEAHAYRDQMRSLYEVAYSLSTTMDYRHVLEAMLREVHKLVPFYCGFVLLSSGQQDELYVAASKSLISSDQSRRVALGNGSIAATLRRLDAQVINDLQREAEWREFDTLRDCRSACLIPLRAGMRTYGLAVIASDRPDAFKRDQIEMLTTLANYAIIALHNAQLIFDLKEERAKLLSKEEQVRHQLARDLHDGPAQSLAAITMNVEFIKRLLDRDPQRVIEELDKLSTLAKRTTYEVRTMLFELRPLVLETQGLKVTLEQYLERFQNNSANTKIVLDADGVEDVHLSTKTEGTLFNIIQEAVNNALKHARAKHIWIRLSRTGDELCAVVQDDGVGFDKDAVLRSYEQRGSFGLLNIDERARLVSGHAEMDSAPGTGTTVTVVVPIEQ